jgi:hypothetical protein
MYAFFDLKIMILTHTRDFSGKKNCPNYKGKKGQISTTGSSK